jgi:hypothetical protein
MDEMNTMPAAATEAPVEEEKIEGDEVAPDVTPEAEVKPM